LTIAQHIGLVGRVFLQRGDRLFRATLLGDTNNSIEDQNCEDDDGVNKGAPAALILEERQDKRDNGRTE
jgi:hypothetical protein